ncbi:hypothetical protein B0H16DRAFT_1502741 [Mycena metata]|uniref:Uncharacterized protein n=1 Tax=Mycena metata TaxID=1033252 RepID=A0AAD7K4I3_9AGAR|nr:hypothetical protein B0H16DRAFT_1502741 [Mycena metata]
MASEEFWRRIYGLTTRARNHEGQWVGSPEVEAWNRKNRVVHNNIQKCVKCSSSRNPKQCIIELDQASCRACREAKMACDRKLQFLFDSTRDQYFDTMEEFLTVFNEKDDRCRIKLPRNKIVSAPEAAILVTSSENSAQNGVYSGDDFQAVYSVVERRLLRQRLAELGLIIENSSSSPSSVKYPADSAGHIQPSNRFPDPQVMYELSLVKRRLQQLETA